jgi:hypothetical protein
VDGAEGRPCKSLFGPARVKVRKPVKNLTRLGAQLFHMRFQALRFVEPWKYSDLAVYRRCFTSRSACQLHRLASSAQSGAKVRGTVQFHECQALHHAPTCSPSDHQQPCLAYGGASECRISWTDRSCIQVVPELCCFPVAKRHGGGEEKTSLLGHELEIKAAPSVVFISSAEPNPP